ncbi:hypothetical protein G7K_4087-t1 [Saitoella complicata NRRL Y-17804]|uniref:Fatty acid desaturase domain-containing protein n=2 Tax=Saitoella complicata (strain BCRC 22490 / CBS 7301 / JCM 7358 / NBRC 10748 / NRRL Y-17804) TaxID=698492 RepID=A0A0E9NJU5_SAICN|nr:hypothetical protein G7K_4087-t1 [Saitoella complicata NRRL Y-17804]
MSDNQLDERDIAHRDVDITEAKSEEVYRDTYGREWTPPTFTMKEIYEAIPAHCFERSNLHSYMFVARDFFYIICLGLAASQIYRLESAALRFLAWTVYSILQGMVGTGIWVLAHECGHQAFSPSKTINDATGWVLHSFLLVPYFSWKFSHGTHHKNTGNLDRDMVFVPKSKSEKIANKGANPAEFAEEHNENGFLHLVEETPLATFSNVLVQQLFGWPMYLFTDVTAGPKYPDVPKHKINHFHPDSPLYRPEQFWAIVASDIGVGLTLTALYFAAQTFGWANVALYYGVPYLWVNHWLVMITFLQHTDPSLPHYRGKAWNFARGAAATIDRDFGFIGRHIFHGIIEYHVAHHYISRIPFYHGEEATNAIRKVIGEHYMRDDTNFFLALWRSARMCQWVADKGEIVFFQNANGLGAGGKKAKAQ